MITMPGQRLCLISSPRNISNVYRNTVELTFDVFIRDLLRALGSSESAIDKWIPARLSNNAISTPAESLAPKADDFTHLGEKLCQRQLHHGKEFDILQKAIVHGINDAVTWEKIKPEIVLQSTSEVRTLSLLGWCREVLLEIPTRVFFGDRLLSIEPDLIDAFSVFDTQSWKLHFGYPKFLAQELYAARDKINVALTFYFRLSPAERPDACFLISSLEVEMRKLSIGDEDIAAITMPLYWV